MELSPEKVTTTKELSGQKLRKVSLHCRKLFAVDFTTRDDPYYGVRRDN